MWYDIWSFSYKQQILNFWSRSEMVRKLRFQTGLSENCVFGPPGEPVFSKILKNYFFMISFISFNDIITFLKHLGKMTFLRLYLPLNANSPGKKWSYVVMTTGHIGDSASYENGRKKPIDPKIVSKKLPELKIKLPLGAFVALFLTDHSTRTPWVIH